MTDTTDLVPSGTAAADQADPTSGAGADAAAANEAGGGAPAAPAAAPRTRRRATSGGLASMVLPELQALAGNLGISGVGRLRKSQLIEAIQSKQAGSSGGGAAAPAGGAGQARADEPAGGPGQAAAGQGGGLAQSEAPSAAAPAAPSSAAPSVVDAGAGADLQAPAARRTSAGRGTGRRSAVGSQAAGTDATGTDATAAAGALGDARDEGTSSAGSSSAGSSSAGSSSAGTAGAGSSSGGSPVSGATARVTTDAAAGASAGTGSSSNGPDRSSVDGTAADGSDGDRGDGDRADGDRADRVDRGRERFLEREARRQERLAAAGGGNDEAAGEIADGASARTDRGQRERGDRGDRPQRDRGAGDRGAGDRYQGDRSSTDRNQSDRYQADRGQPDRSQPDRSQGDRYEGQPRDGGGRDGQSRDGGPRDNGTRDDEDFTGGRRGRFRERGRGRNRNSRTDRFGGEPEPMISDDDVLIPVGGILDILENYGFIRTSGYLTGPNDVYVTLQQVRKYGLRRGDAVTGAVRQQREGEHKDKYNALVRLDSVNGVDPEESKKRPDFTKLTPLYPQDRLRLETEPGILTTRVIDLVMPVGKGQRALIVSPPKAGKTMVMQAIANAITTNNPECHLMVVLVDERPEEVTDMQRSVKGEVIASTFDRPPQDHITVAELSIERAKRLVELGHDVVVLLDSITRLGRAYNLGAPASGRILTGGVDSAALYPPKRFLGAARNIENGGSLTIFATALVETGSAMDTVIFEEFKGTGNAELKLDRRLADKRIFPAIDVDASGTRKEEILLAPEELRIVLQLRRVLHALDTSASLELLLDKMKSTRTNVEFLMQIQKTTVNQDG